MNYEFISTNVGKNKNVNKNANDFIAYSEFVREE